MPKIILAQVLADPVLLFLFLRGSLLPKINGRMITLLQTTITPLHKIPQPAGTKNPNPNVKIVKAAPGRSLAVSSDVP